MPGRLAVYLLAGVLLSEHPSPSQGIASGSLGPATRLPRTTRPFPVRFVDAAPEAGLQVPLTYGDPLNKKFIVEANGAGVALIDYDGDGRLDIFLPNGGRWSGSPGPEPTSHLYRNLGNWKFADVTAPTGTGRSGWGNGVCGGDVDNDGRADLYVTYWGKNSLYRNVGGGRFEEIAEAAGVAGGASDWSTGCSFLDYDRDGRQDLLVVTYAGFDRKTTPAPGQFPYCTWKGAPVFCGPRGLPPGRMTLYRNRGDGVFENVTHAARIDTAPPCYAFTVTAADLDGDGWTDLYIACDSTPSALFRNQRDGTFRELGTESGLAFNENGSEQAGMGIAIADYDGDGRMDLAKTNFSGDYPNLYRNLGKMVFQDVPARAGLAVNPNFVLWGMAFADLDHDGWFDLVQVAGHVYPNVSSIDPRESYRQRRLIYRNLGDGRFEDVSDLAGPAVTVAESSRGAVFADLDGDGDLDAVIVNMHRPPSLWRHEGVPSNHWLKVRLPPAAMGASVKLTVNKRMMVQPMLSQSSFLSHAGNVLHFGLGAENRYESLEVTWPSGRTETFPGGVGARAVDLVEGTGTWRDR